MKHWIRLFNKFLVPTLYVRHVAQPANQGKYGVDPKLIRILKNLYEGIMAFVRIEGENTEEFNVKTGLRQGCILSPTLVDITLDYMRRAMEGRERIQVGERSLKDTEYADDALY